ncbi:tRNA (guanosine(46)-N7)-methyltransferase TrmB [Anatilimnocola floriformis]|uniref:tRNA (guanosine(46)-N7)-methyltransferase TrmB n=1 Tax=Anatilimnocola floriformis TaxID=2948575 RepID=UPI0020C408D5|nr:tRNA (guanosine(46)-N7)-methyltransferase TrmB [Anatilimnocola floriformis]
MGRRALPKIDPTLDLATHLVETTDVPKPFDPVAMFGRSAPLEVEVGSGKGLFMLSASGANPEHNFFGIEVAKKYSRFAASRLSRAGRTNAKMACGDALAFFREAIVDSSLHAVHVYFPDPWWKKRHRRRRVLNESFLQDVIRTLIPGGKLHFWTDVEEYYQSTLELIAQLPPNPAGKLQGPLAVPETPAEHDLDFRTHFERRTRLHELPVYRSEFLKEAAGAGN